MDAGNERGSRLYLVTLPHRVGRSRTCDWTSATLNHLSCLLDLPPSYGSIGLQSVERSDDEELLGSFAGIIASLIAFYRKTDLPVYIAIAEAREAMRDASGLLDGDAKGMEPDSLALVPSIRELGEVAARNLANTPTDDQLTLATQLGKGYVVVEVPCRWNMTGDPSPDHIITPEPRSLM